MLVSSQILSFLLHNLDISPEMKEAYQYGIEITISSILNIVLILICSLIAGDIFAGITYLFIFIFLRSFTGGYHATTYFRCNATFVVTFILTFCFYKAIIYFEIPFFVCETIALMNLIPIVVLSPVPNKHKPLTAEQRKHSYKLSFIIASVLTLIGLSLRTVIYYVSESRVLLRKVRSIMVKFAVCDDEQEMIDCISDKLRIYYQDECEIKTYNNGASLLSDFHQDCFDALFLDIGLSGVNGIKIAEKIRENDQRVKIIFVSDQNELAYKGYLYNAFRFVRKSNLEQELCEAAKSLQLTFSSQSERLVFKTATGETILEAKDIKYFEAKSHFINAVCNDGVVRVYGTLHEYEERMINNGFIRIHKSYLVNFRYIRSIKKNVVILKCGNELPLSRYRVRDIKMKMMAFSRSLATHTSTI